MGTRVPTIYVLSKNKKNVTIYSSENYHFYSREILQYIAYAYLRNETGGYMALKKVYAP